MKDYEIAKLGKVMTEAVELNPYRVTASRLILLTGCRKSEILSLKWQHVDWDNSCLVMPDSKTGAKAVPIGPAAIDLLKAIPSFSKSDYVFPSLETDGHFVGVQKIWDTLRSRAGLEDVRIHDLRRTFGSMGAAQGQSLITIGKVLGHADPKTTAIYAHLTDGAVKSAATQSSDAISKFLSGAGQNEK